MPPGPTTLHGVPLSWLFLNAPKQQLGQAADGAPPLRNEKFADLYGSFSVKWFLFVAGSLFGAERLFLVPSPAIRFAERAEGVKGPKC